MVNCSYCGKELDRLVFCSPSHKVIYHQGKHLPIVNKKEDTLPKVNTPLETKVATIDTKEDLFKGGLCKHGRPPSLCEDVGCKRA